MNEVTEQIKEKIDIVEFIQSAGVQLKKSGRSYVGFCPFHSNTKTPAFTVYPESQSFHCFGCKASGTVFDFMMRRDGLEFRDALEQLARRAGVTLQERTQEDVQQDQLRTRLLEINQAAAAFFHHVLVKSPRGEQARAYVQRRALNQETIESFQLGYAVDEWSALLSYLTDRKGFEPEEVEAAGLAIRRENGGYYDRFRGRIMFPIRNPKGEIIAFGGRAMGDAQPKYMNSPQTALFDKSRVLYGFDLARDAIRSSEAAVIVEGYVDVIMAHQYGFRNVVAPLGTALTSEHVELVKRITQRIYLALDADPAGVRAALKGANQIEKVEDAKDAIIVGNLYGKVQLLSGIELRVIALPSGKDPDEVIQTDPGEWKTLYERAKPAMDFYFDVLTVGLDLHSADGKSEAVSRLAPLIGQIADEIKFRHYVQQLARMIDSDESVVMRVIPNGTQAVRKSSPVQRNEVGTRPAMRQAAQPSGSPSPLGSTTLQEEHLLCLVLLHRSARDAVLAKLRQDLAHVPIAQQVLSQELVDLFERPEHRAIIDAWQQQPEAAEATQWVAALDSPLRETAQLALTRTPPSPQAYRYVNDALECATILQQHQAKRWLTRMTRQAAEASDDEERLRAIEFMVQLKEYLGMISAPRRSSTYADLHHLHTA
jgi:DNA primase